jgi:hypothetical protein
MCYAGVCSMCYAGVCSMCQVPWHAVLAAACAQMLCCAGWSEKGRLAGWCIRTPCAAVHSTALPCMQQQSSRRRLTGWLHIEQPAQVEPHSCCPPAHQLTSGSRRRRWCSGARQALPVVGAAARTGEAIGAGQTGPLYVGACAATGPAGAATLVVGVLNGYRCTAEVAAQHVIPAISA